MIQPRHYQAADWQRVSEIHDLARPIELEGSCDPRAFVPLAEDKDDLSQFNECKKIVALLNDQVCGFIGINENEIGWLYVDPKESRKGIGRFLLKNALSHISETAIVHVLDGNLKATNLYQSEGFVITNTFKSKNNGYPCTVNKLVRAAGDS